MWLKAYISHVQQNPTSSSEIGHMVVLLLLVLIQYYLSHLIIYFYVKLDFGSHEQHVIAM